MRKIKIEKWKSKVPKYDDEGKIVGTTEKDETLLDAINVLIGSKDPKDMPRGLDNFRTMSRLSKAFEKAEKTNVLELEEADYKFIKDDLEKNIPSSWGMNQNIMNAVEEFLNAKAEE
ncbi:MAG: hypothetical protein ACFFG0_03065 [Candidatus Thorarchaeota archaeon]